MICVIIAGGSGTRLWPLSTPNYPKHLLKINGSNNSLLKSTYLRSRRLTDKVYIVSDSSHIHHVREQLPEIGDEYFITEPDRRGTANCIVAALACISKRHDDTEQITFVHADHYIRDIAGFTYSFKLAERVAARENRIVLVGIEPDKPEVGFGYIEKGDPLTDQEALIFNVNSFKEKPDYQTAKVYLKSGNYLWNGGYFLGSLQTFLDSMQKYAPDLYHNYERLLGASTDKYNETYLSFDPIAIDYALIEKVPNLLVVQAAFDWMDLGSFKDISSAIGGDSEGNYIEGEQVEVEDVKNSIVYNHENKPVAIIGLDGVVVVNAPNGLLITRKDLSQKVGEVSKRFKHDKDQ